jgi:N6-adenosine-specific RNA methylase IME4
MSMEEIIDFAERIKQRAMHDAVMFMWVTSPVLFDNPGPREVIEAAGFEYKACFVWDKQLHNVGRYVSNRHEFLLICTRGACTPDRLTPMIDSVVSVQRGEHSAKPEDFRKIIERLYDGPYLELFGRNQVDGWTVYGDDPALLGEKKTQKPTIKKSKVAKQKKQRAKKSAVGSKAPKAGKRRSKQVGEIQQPSGEVVASIDEDAPVLTDALKAEFPDAVVTTIDALTPEQIDRIDREFNEYATIAAAPVELCKKHRMEPKPCAKCKAEKQSRKKK